MAKGAQFVRLHTSGDFFIQTDCGTGYQLDVLYFLNVVKLAIQNPNVTFWTYCHDVSKLVEFGFDYLNGSLPSNLHTTASVDSDAAREYAKSH
ncbi:GP88 family protein, partial [Enterococcus faecium]|uniref:GP88 family protein n=1 Tax=Enterococcus faecium TaxID=1352 RepID=UPI003D662F35